MQVRLKLKVTVVLFSGCLIASALLAETAWADHSTRVQSRQARQAITRNADGIAEQISLLAARVRDTQFVLEKLESDLPQEAQLPGIAGDLLKLVEVNSLNSQPLRATRASCIEPLGEQILSMTLTGDFNGFYAFLLQLEQMRYPVRIRSMKMQPLTNRDGDLRADVVLSITFKATAMKMVSDGGPGLMTPTGLNAGSTTSTKLDELARLQQTDRRIETLIGQAQPIPSQAQVPLSQLRMNPFHQGTQLQPVR